jgi:ligand-binding SRPBCC domain-containing protein
MRLSRNQIRGDNDLRSVHTGEHVFRKVTEIACPVDRVWERVTTQEGINDEMGPYLKMTMPRQFRGKSIADVAPGTRIGKSLLLLFGVLPFGFDDITIAKIDPGRMFREESAMTGMRIWVHHRTLEPVGNRTIVTDEITLAPRAPMGLVPGWGKLVSTVLSAFFTHRHRRLSRRLTGPGATQ